MIVRYLTGINVFPLWSHYVSTITPNKKTTSTRSKIICRIWYRDIRFFEFLRLRNLGILQIKVFLIIYFWGNGLKNSLWVGWYRKYHRSAYLQKNQWTHFETVFCGLRHLGCMGDGKSCHMWLWKREFSRSGRGKMRSRHPKQLCFWRSFFQ